MIELAMNAVNTKASIGRGYAIVIGVSAYQKIKPLPDAVTSDAGDLTAVLTSEAYCGYGQDDVHLLVDSDATLQNIRSVLASIVSSSTCEDSVVIFFSGHGARMGASHDTQTALLPVECDPADIESTSLSEVELSAVLRRTSARRVLVLIDACYAAGAANLKDSAGGRQVAFGYAEKSLARLAQGIGRVFIASSRATEKSRIMPGARNSLFTSALLEALRGEADTQGDGLIRIFDIFNYVSQTVKGTAPGRQHPVFEASNLEDNFPVALERGGVKSHTLQPKPVSPFSLWNELEQLLPDLYPSGPLEQEVWTRAGGDPSRLHHNDMGRTLWLKALRTLRLGGGGIAISGQSLVTSALQDYPHHPSLLALQKMNP